MAFYCLRGVQEQDPDGWNGMQKLRRSILFEIIEALTATEKEPATYLEGFGVGYRAASSNLETGDFVGYMPASPEYRPVSPTYDPQ